MPKRRSQKEVRDPKQKPKGPSRYELKQRRLATLQTPQVTQPAPQQKREKPAQPNWTKPARRLPSGTTLAFGKVSEMRLKTGGYVFLMDNQGRKIYLSDGTLESFDTNYTVTIDTCIECAVTKEARGFRAVVVYSITPP